MPSIRLQALHITDVLALSCQHLGHSRPVAVEPTLQTRTRAAHPATGRTHRRNFQLHQQPIFRGKIAYAEAFSKSETGFASTLVMTTSRGLLLPETIIGLDDLREMSAVPIEPSDARYREPLCRDAGALARVLPTGSQIVLLGSIASPKYVDPLLEIFGADLLFPREFVGRGDMSRGGLMLRCLQVGLELDYVSVQSAIRRGPRPPKLSSNKPAAHLVDRKAG